MIILFKENETKFDHLGVGVLKDTISCKVAESLNDSFELELEYPIFGQHYSDIKIDSIIYSKSSPNSKQQPFRVYSISKPINGIVTIHALHISYDMNGIIINPITEGTLQDILKQLETNSILPHDFKFYTKVQSNKTYQTNGYYNLRALLFGSEESILESYKLEIEFDNYNIYLKERRGANKHAEIRYGKNMTDLEHEFNHDLLYNYVYPYYHKETSSQSTSTTIGEFKKAYIVGNKPLQDGWLSFEENGEPYHPVNEAPVQIATDGDYYNKVFTWDSTKQKYKERLYDQQITLIEGVMEPEWITIDWSGLPSIVVRAKKDGYFKGMTDTEYKHYNIGDIVFAGSIRNITSNLVLYYSEVIPPTEAELDNVSTSVTHIELTSKLLKVDTELANKMTFNRILNLDLTKEFDDDENEEQQINDETLTQKALKFIKENKIGQYKYNTTVSFADLANSTEGIIYKDLETVELGDTVRIVYEALDIDIELRVISVTYDALLDRYSSIELGEKSDTISSSSVQTGDNVSSLTNDKGFTDEKTVSSIIAKTVTADFIEATNAKLSKAQIEDLETVRIKISGMLEASQAEIDTLVAKMLVAENAVIKKTLEAGEIKVSGDITVKSGEISIQNDDGSKVFRVDREGNLYANSAVIQGRIEAAEGHIGGFNITETAIWNNIESMYSENENGVYIGPDGISLGKQLKIYPNGLIISHAYTDQSTMSQLLIPNEIKPSIQRKATRSISSFNGIILGSMSAEDVNNLINVTNFIPNYSYQQNDLCIYENQLYRAKITFPTPPSTFQPISWASVSEYDPTRSYNTNERCIHQGLIYKCLDDGITGSWNTGEWELIGQYIDLNSNYVINISTSGTIINGDGSTLSVSVGDNITIQEVYNTTTVIWRKMDAEEFNNIYNYTNDSSVTQINDEISKTSATGDIYKVLEDERVLNASEYNADNTYNTDELCIHSNKYYKCLEDAVTGTWNSSKWEEVSISDYRKLLNSDGSYLSILPNDYVIFVADILDSSVWQWTKYYVNESFNPNYFGLTPEGILYANGAIISGDITVKSGEISIQNANGSKVFRVDRDGNLTATSATIKGRIEADEGYIAGFKLETSIWSWDAWKSKITHDNAEELTSHNDMFEIAIAKSSMPYIHMESVTDETNFSTMRKQAGYIYMSPRLGLAGHNLSMILSEGLVNMPAEYSTSKVYNINDYCRKYGEFYKCLVDGTTGDWDPSKWLEVEGNPVIGESSGVWNTITYHKVPGHEHLGTVHVVNNEPSIDNSANDAPDKWYNKVNFIVTMNIQFPSSWRNMTINLWEFFPHLYNIVALQVCERYNSFSTDHINNPYYELIATDDRIYIYRKFRIHNATSGGRVTVTAYCNVRPYRIQEDCFED